MSELHIFLVEDNRADILLIREALAAYQVPYQLQVAANGAEAIEFVDRMGTPSGPACPDLVLLDLNLPRIDGAEVLREFRRHPDCLNTPVIVMSSSDTPRDREKVSRLGVTRYFRKPTTFDAFMLLGALIKEVVDGG